MQGCCRPVCTLFGLHRSLESAAALSPICCTLTVGHQSATCLAFDALTLTPVPTSDQTLSSDASERLRPVTAQEKNRVAKRSALVYKLTLGRGHDSAVEFEEHPSLCTSNRSDGLQHIAVHALDSVPP